VSDTLTNVSRIVDKHLKSLAPKHIDTKFIKLDAEVSMNHSIEMILEFALGLSQCNCIIYHVFFIQLFDLVKKLNEVDY